MLSNACHAKLAIGTAIDDIAFHLICFEIRIFFLLIFCSYFPVRETLENLVFAYGRAVRVYVICTWRKMSKRANRHYSYTINFAKAYELLFSFYLLIVSLVVLRARGRFVIGCSECASHTTEFAYALRSGTFSFNIFSFFFLPRYIFSEFKRRCIAWEKCSICKIDTTKKPTERRLASFHSNQLKCAKKNKREKYGKNGVLHIYDIRCMWLCQLRWTYDHSLVCCFESRVERI